MCLNYLIWINPTDHHFNVYILPQHAGKLLYIYCGIEIDGRHTFVLVLFALYLERHIQCPSPYWSRERHTQCPSPYWSQERHFLNIKGGPPNRRRVDRLSDLIDCVRLLESLLIIVVTGLYFVGVIISRLLSYC